MFIITYLDNILIYLKNKEDYIKYIRIVLEYLNKHYLRLKPLKYKFYKEELNFLRYIIGVNRVKISKEKVYTI